MTPGPWRPILGLDGVTRVINPNGATVCTVENPDNALVIAGLPDLIEALKRLPLSHFNKEDLDAAEFVDHANDFVEAMKLAREALNKTSVL